MKTIRISDEVWKAIEKHGKFMETPDDVLRRVLGVSQNRKRAGSKWNKVATDRMVARVRNSEMSIGFASGLERRWKLPSRDNKLEIRKVRDEAVRFAKGAKATPGQVNAVFKALTHAGYHLTK
ncbi:MAG: hypothetical protein HY525_20050 [Betaproteobacteria bacterium]|nr:hypothetical protein [Betaproteobacteria bacterium]